MKYADKIGAEYTVVVGDDEINQNQYPLKNMQTGETKPVSPDALIQELL